MQPETRPLANRKESFMSLHPHTVDPIPEQTARIAHAAFRRGNPFMRMRDEIGTLFTDEAFAPLFPARGRPVVSPWRLALVCVMQYVEGLSDRQAAEAVRARIDWKYSLSLALEDPGFDASVLSEFRTRLVSGGLEQRMLDLLLERFRAHKLLKARGKQRTDSTHVLAAIRAVNRLECVGETMRAALNSLAVVAPDWLRAHSDPQWVDRYGPRVDETRLPEKPEARRGLAPVIAADGYRLLEALSAPDAPVWLREVPAVQTLRRVWIERFYRAEERVEERGDAQGRPPSAGMISSPYDPDARYATKRTTSWTGYKVHLSETCDDDLPRLITHVETAPGPTADGDATPIIHHALAAKGLLPDLHIVDTGYLDAELLLASRDDYGVELLGPTRRDQRWQARAKEGFGMAAFADRLGAATRAMPPRMRKHPVGRTHRCARQREHLHSLCEGGLRPLSLPCPMHQSRAPVDRHPSPRAVRGLTGAAGPAGNGGLRSGVCPPRRDRGNDLAGGARFRLAAREIHRYCQDASAACPDGGGDRLRPRRRVAR